MADVNVFEPWHVALRDAVVRLTPRSGFTRLIAASGALTIASVITALGAWIVARGDIVAFLIDVASDAFRAAVTKMRNDAVTAFLDPAPDLLRGSGWVRFVVAFLGIVGIAAASALWLRVLAESSARRRHG
ncbi:MAG: hypothetical protein NVS1B4_08910 [Gemmatimonadaceae bacterium]